MSHKIIYVTISVIVLMTGLIVAGYLLINRNKTEVVTYKDCLKAKNAFILPTFPEQCRVNGKTFVNESAPTEPVISKFPIPESANILVDFPKENSEVGMPLIISGSARVYENQFNYLLKDSQGKVIAQGTAYAKAENPGFYGYFEISVNYQTPIDTAGTVELFDYSAKDGSEIDKVVIPVHLKKPTKGTSLPNGNN